MKLSWLISLLITAVFLIACQRNEPAPQLDGSPTLNPTQQAVAAVLTRQAANPRPTRTRDRWVNISQTEQAAFKTRAILTENAPTATPTLPATLTFTPQARMATLLVPAGMPPTLDGQLAIGEWGDGVIRFIPLANGSQVGIRFKHDTQFLYLAFDRLDSTEVALFPELLLDTAFDGGTDWNENDAWYHVSTNYCWGSGPQAIWQTCELNPEGWQATGFGQSQSVIEMAIPLTIRPGETVGLALALFSLGSDGSDRRQMWPETADWQQPSSWAAITLNP